MNCGKIQSLVALFNFRIIHVIPEGIAMDIVDTTPLFLRVRGVTSLIAFFNHMVQAQLVPTPFYSTCLLRLCGTWHFFGNHPCKGSKQVRSVTTACSSHCLNSEIFPKFSWFLSAVFCLAAFRLLWNKICLLAVTRSQIQETRTAFAKYHCSSACQFHAGSQWQPATLQYGTIFAA